MLWYGPRNKIRGGCGSLRIMEFFIKAFAESGNVFAFCFVFLLALLRCCLLLVVFVSFEWMTMFMYAIHIHCLVWQAAGKTCPLVLSYSLSVIITLYICFHYYFLQGFDYSMKRNVKRIVAVARFLAISELMLKPSFYVYQRIGFWVAIDCVLWERDGRLVLFAWKVTIM